VYQARSLQSDSLSGQFEGNPVVAIDSLTPLERRRAVEDEAEKGIERSKKLKGAKLLLGFVPRYGEALGKALEAGYAVAENAREAGLLVNFHRPSCVASSCSPKLFRTPGCATVRRRGCLSEGFRLRPHWPWRIDSIVNPGGAPGS
jgi:hypothetical protein